MTPDEFLRVQRQIEDVQPRKRAHPKGWEPGVDTAKGVVTVQGGDQPPQDWSVIIRELGLDPAAWTVDTSQPVQVRTWDSGEQRCFYYRATVLPASPDAVGADLEALLKAAQRRRGKSAQNASQSVLSDSDGRALAVVLSDWQAGKDLGDGKGPEQLIERLLHLRDAVPARLKQLKKAGVEVDTVAVLALGDLSESCSGHYAMQEFQTVLDYRQQARLTRRMLVELLSAWSGLTPNMQVACVPANHGERRKNGKAFTNWGDNTDVEVFEVVRDAFQLDKDRFGHILWGIPDQEQWVAIDICGTTVGLIHGHQFRAGAAVQQKALNWWKSMAMNRTAIGDADLLLSGHFHHFQAFTEGVADSPKGRTWMQAPALDPGSPWWEHQGGAPTQQGTLTMTIDGNGWDNLQIIR